MDERCPVCGSGIVPAGDGSDRCTNASCDWRTETDSEVTPP